jgi:2-phospho-L-lactate/phosphoenolpyruvate guanylyltransferase
MKALLIPVKELARAKQRLTDELSTEARVALADALWQDFFEVVTATTGIDRVFVVTLEVRVLERARELGWETIHESYQISESDSVDFASRVCEDRGVTSLLRLPVDLPWIEPGDIHALFEQVSAKPSCVIVPSRDGTGTNALLRTPPTLFRSRFGPGSFEKHLAEAAQAKAVVTKLRNPRIEVDIDDTADLALINTTQIRGQRTRQWLAENPGLAAQSGQALRRKDTGAA